MPVYPGLHYFKEGISKIKQWTGTDHKQLQRVFVTTLVDTTPHWDVLHAAQNLLDFIYLAQYLSHIDNTLSAMQVAPDDFHTVKDVFVDLKCHEHFNIPKLHSLQHYIKTIKNLGSLDGLNSEHSECLHIDYAKKAYAASNHKDYTIQMAWWLQRQEAVARFKSFLAWRTGNPNSQLTDDRELAVLETTQQASVAALGNPRNQLSHEEWLNTQVLPKVSTTGQGTCRLSKALAVD